MYYVHNKANGASKTASYYVRDFSGGVESVTDEQILPLAYAAESENFAVKSGVLCDAGGVKAASSDIAELPPVASAGKAQKLYYFKTYNQTSGVYQNRLLAYLNDGYVYQSVCGAGAQFEKIEELDFAGAPSAVRYTYNGKNVIIFCYGDSMKIFDGQNVEVVQNAPSVTSMCMHGERLFATEGGEKTTLWYSDDFDPANWDVSLSEAGFIDLRDERGSLLKAVEADGYVYVFRNYGITRVSAYGDQTEFATDGLSSSSGRIYGDSITVCGEKIVYLAEDGFYCFGGSYPYRILTKLDGLLCGVDNSGAKGVFYNGELFVLLKLKLKSGVTPCVLRYDFSGKSVSFISGAGVTDLEVLNGENDYKLLFLCENSLKIGELSNVSERFGTAIQKSWVSGASDLSKPEVQKTLRGISLYASKPVSLVISSERGTKTLNFSGNNSDEYLKTALSGKAFTFCVKSSVGDCRAGRLKIDFEYRPRS